MMLKDLQHTSLNLELKHKKENKIMTQEEKQLLLQDLCARLMYRVKCFVPVENCIMELTGKRLNYFCFHKEEWGYDYSHEFEVVLDPLNDSHNGYIVKPYLRPISSMTSKEWVEFCDCSVKDEASWVITMNRQKLIPVQNREDYLNSKHFDYRGLIEKGLAIAVTEDNNPYKE